MNFLIISSSNPTISAGIVAQDLSYSLKEHLDAQVKILTSARDNYNSEDIIVAKPRIHFKIEKIIYFQRRVLNYLNRKYLKHKLFPKRNREYSFQKYDLTKSRYSTQQIVNQLNKYRPDAIIVVFNVDFLNFKDIATLSTLTSSPILFYMMDMAPITGGCHYAWNCNGYSLSCGKCPGLYSENNFDQSYKNFRFKKQYIDKMNCIPIAATEEQFKQLNNSLLFKEKVKTKVLLSCNPEVFKLKNKEKARISLNLPASKKIIFIGAMDISSKRKGSLELMEVLSKLNKIPNATNKYHLLFAGNLNDRIMENISINFTSLGYINHGTLSTAFNAADLFLCTSIEDSGPMMINQSIMCGTPVVCFKIGVSFDLVKNEKTGYLADLKNTNQMIQGISYISNLDSSEYSKMQDNCLNIANTKLLPSVQARGFENILKSVSA